MRFWRRLSIATKLPIGIAALLAVVTAGLSVTAWAELRDSVERAATERLESVTQQLSAQFSDALGSRLSDMDSMAVALGIGAALASRSQADLERIRNELVAQYDPNNEIIGVALWDRNAVPVLRTTDAYPVMELEEARRLAGRVAESDGFVGRFRVRGEQAATYPLLVPLRANDTIVGYLSEVRRGSSRESIDELSRFLGSSARILVGSPLGGEWTDLVSGTPSPPPGLDLTLPYNRYRRAGEAVMAHGRPVPATEWLLLVEFPAQVVSAPVNQFTRRLAFLSVAFIALGGLVGWVASRRMTSPLQRLARGVDAVAAGQPLDDDLRSDRADEIGRLGEAFMVMAADVARSREALEDRVKERTFALQSANAELESFSYSVSHDLRAPLRAIDGFSRILTEDHNPELSAEARHCVSVISRNSRQMGQLIDDLLALSRIGRQELSEATIDMTTLAESVADEIRRHEPDRDLRIRVDALPPARGERTLVRQVFTNLLGNAAKFTRPRDSSRVEVGSYREDEKTVYYVRDDGVGFDMKYADKMFGVFQRLHRPDEFEGTGVGLAIVHRIVTRHDGRVWAHGEPGRGATFFFTLS